MKKGPEIGAHLRATTFWQVTGQSLAHPFRESATCAGTIFHATHLPLTTRFLAIYLLTQRKSGLSELQLSRDLGAADNAAWKLKHKVLQVMHDHNQTEKLSGRIEIDDAYLGGGTVGKTGSWCRA